MAALVKEVPNLDFSILPLCGGIPWLSISSVVGKVEDTMSIWDHAPLPELVQQAGVQLKPVGEEGWVGPHPHKHGSKRGECLVLWPARFWCSSCKAKGDPADWLIDYGKAENRHEAAKHLSRLGVQKADLTSAADKAN